MKNIIKKILAIWISIYLIIVPPFAHAASPSGWAFNSFDVATSVVTAVKNGASASVAVAKSPITAKIAKGIVGGAIVGAALPLAISQITGIALTSLDWVLDPANNAIKYKDTSVNPDMYRYLWSAYGKPAVPYSGIMSNACDIALNQPTITSCTPNSIEVLSNTKVKVHFTYFTSDGGTRKSNYPYDRTTILNPDYNDYKTIPIPTIADKIYDNAKTDTASASIVNDAVKDYVNSGAADVALDAAKAETDATHNCGTGTHWSGSACVADTPTTPSTPTTPDTPFDPSSIIDAIKGVFDAVMSLPDVINNALDSLLNDIKDFFQPVIDKVTDTIDWVKTTYDEFVKPDDSPTDVDVDVPQTPSIDTSVNFGGSCPANVTGSFVIGGRTTTFNIMDWSQFCIIMSTYLKPLVIALASYQAVKILAGRNESN